MWALVCLALAQEPEPSSSGSASEAGGAGPRRFGRRSPDPGQQQAPSLRSAAHRASLSLFSRLSAGAGGGAPHAAHRSLMTDGEATDAPAGEYNYPGEQQARRKPKARRGRRRSKLQGHQLTPSEVATMPEQKREELQADAYREFALSLVDMLGSPGVHHGNNPAKGMADVGLLMNGGAQSADPNVVLQQQTTPEALAELGGRLPGLWQKKQEQRREERAAHVSGKRQAAREEAALSQLTSGAAWYTSSS